MAIWPYAAKNAAPLKVEPASIVFYSRDSLFMTYAK
jgi:hypothetical protein